MQSSLTGIAFNVVSEMFQLSPVTHDPIIIFVLPNYFLMLRAIFALFLSPIMFFQGMQNIG